MYISSIFLTTTTLLLSNSGVFISANPLAIRDSCTIPSPTCSNPGPKTTYFPEPCFPKYGVCYPQNYYAAQTEGPFSGPQGSYGGQLSAKCRAICDNRSGCASYVGVINNQGDTTGVCFYYSSQQISARQCANPPDTMFAYYKQNVCSPTATSTAALSTGT